MNRKEKINRRVFVKTGTMAIGAAACLSVGLKEALAHERATGALVFTVDNLNRFFAQKRAAGTIKTVAAEISRDIKGWLKREYSLTPIQIRRIDACTPADWDNIRGVLTFVAKTGGALTIETTDQSLQTATAAHHAFASCKTKVKAEVKNADGTTTKVDAEVELAS